MTITFERPIGAPADLKELEYLSAISQTCLPELRRDGSLDASDICNFLSSRHGIIVDVETVKKHILVDLTGELEVEPAFNMDLVEMTALLLIPYLLNGDESNAALEQVLEVMLEETDSCKLNRDFLKTLLEFHGETQVADEVLEDMVNAAGGEGAVLNLSSLRQALTSDVKRYGRDWDERLTTHYEDVFSEPPNDNLRNPSIIMKNMNSSGDDDDDDNDEEDPNNHSAETTELPFKTVWTAPTMDSTADTYRSQTYAVLLWVCMVIVYLAYFWGYDFTKWSQVDCTNLSEFWCKIINGITRWLVIFLELSILGTTFIFFGSSGNSLFSNKPIAFVRLLVGMTTITFATIVSVFVSVNAEVVSTTKDEDLNVVYWLAFVLGCLLLILQVVTMIRLFVSLDVLKKYKLFELVLTPGIQKMERRTKMAANRKVSRMVENALALHDVGTDSSQSPVAHNRRMTALGKALLNFQIRPEQTERVGGMRWAWKKVFNLSVFDDEGVWIHSRLVACTVAQLLISIFLVVFWLAVFRSALNYVEGGTGSWDSALVSEYVYVWEVVAGATAGIIAGLFASLAITFIYIPSFISTVLKFRSGVIGSLRDRDFLIYRFASEQATVLFGSSFWGCLFTGVSAIILVGGVVFLAVWHVTRSVVITILAQLIGIGVTMLLRMFVLMFLRKQYCAAYYRKPGCVWQDNFMTTCLECWNIGISSGFMLVRTCELFLITAFYLGRLDTPMLASGVGVVYSIAIDSYPNAFRKDLLSHDAHRHPYLERLGTVYMMKLRYGSDFGRRSGACWRMLFVLCLMPWMRKYRLRSISAMEELDQEIEQIELDLNEEQGENTLPLSPETSLKRETTLRQLGRMKNLRHLTQLDGTTSHEQFLEREVILLRERNRQLLADNRKLHWMMAGESAEGYRVGMSLQTSTTESDGANDKSTTRVEQPSAHCQES